MRFLVFAVCLVMSPSFAAESPRERILVSQSGASASRTVDDVRRVIDKHKGGFYALYARALREKPGLQGEVRFSFSINPDGTVSKCAIASSTLNDPGLERGLVERLSAIPFGAKGHKVYVDPGYSISFFTSGRSPDKR
jgi:hypothetical protein